MAYANNMTDLLNKIERRLGLKMVNLPPELDKSTWANEVIHNDTLPTYSRFFPYQIPYHITNDHPKKDGCYFIDEQYVDNFKILGIRDIDWSTFTQDSFLFQEQLGFGSLDYITQLQGFNFEDIAEVSMRANYNSLFSNGIYPIFVPPNKFALKGINNSDIGRSIGNFTVLLLVQHPDSLVTISATMMETFEELAIADVAGYLYNTLKYFDDLETAYATLSLKLDMLETKMNTRDDIVNKLDESHVSASNQNQPMILTV